MKYTLKKSNLLQSDELLLLMYLYCQYFNVVYLTEIFFNEQKAC